MSNVVLQAVRPVLVSQMVSNRSIMTYALYDNGSDGCFITDDILEDLQATGIDSTLKLKTMHGSSYINTHAINNIIVSDIDGHNSIPLPTTFTKKEIPVNHDQIPRPKFLSQWPHLHPISNYITRYLPALSIGILIGSNCPAALEPLQVIPVTDHSPFAALLRHGWTIHGPLEINIDSMNNTMNCNPVIMQDTVSPKEAISPMSLINVFEKDFNDHDIGKVSGQCGPSQEDLKFLKMSSKTIIMQNDNYDGLLFGAVSSPSISNFAMRHITIDHADKLDTEVDKTIKHHFYVDDCLRSVNSQDEAIQLIQNLRSACSSGGFHLKKFTCNDTIVLKTIHIHEHSKELQTRSLDYDELPI